MKLKAKESRGSPLSSQESWCALLSQEPSYGSVCPDLLSVPFWADRGLEKILCFLALGVHLVFEHKHSEIHSSPFPVSSFL